MEVIIKKISELTTMELFEILRTRVDVFVVEQECPYPEIDDIDLESIHVCLKEENHIIGYCRLIPPGVRFESASIGRVLSTKRRQGIATKLLEIAIETIEKEFQCATITIEAQTYARKLYENVGFVQTSSEFLEDGIPHIQMQRKVIQ